MRIPQGLTEPDTGDSDARESKEIERNNRPIRAAEFIFPASARLSDALLDAEKRNLAAIRQAPHL